jgi:hypothetical protein
VQGLEFGPQHRKKKEKIEKKKKSKTRDKIKMEKKAYIVFYVF